MKTITFMILLLFLTNCSTHTVKLGKRCTKIAADNEPNKYAEKIKRVLISIITLKSL